MKRRGVRTDNIVMRLGVLTGVDTRHRYFARRLHEAFGVGAVLYESRDVEMPSLATGDLPPDDAALVTQHFADRRREEERYFGPWAGLLSKADGVSARTITTLELSTLATVAFLTAAGVDTLAVFDTDPIRPPLLTRFAGRCLNLHLGLSPTYRGVEANFHALLNEQPEFVGATVQLNDSGLDSGPIFAHDRPDIEIGDDPHVIECKAIAVGIETMVEVISRFDGGTIRPVPQWSVPHACVSTREDLQPRQVVELHRKFASGMLRRYVSQAVRRNAAVRLVELTRVDATPPAHV